MEVVSVADASTTSQDRVPSSRHLPDEVMLDVLGYALTLPNGIQGDRWESIQKSRMNKFSLLSKSIGKLVPEAIYKANKVVVKAIRPTTQSELRTGVLISYPTIEQSHWVRELEFEPWIFGISWDTTQRDSDTKKRETTVQVEWLQKLASGAIGFERLETLRIKFVPNRLHRADPLHNHPEYIEHFIEELEKVGPLAFKTNVLKIYLDGYRDTGEGANCPNEWIRNSLEKLAALLVIAKPQD